MRHRFEIFFFVLAVEGLIKEWRPRDTDWQNQLNWQGRHLPCSKSDVVLPEEVVVSIYLNGTVGWKSLTMPQTGELVLEDVDLTVGQEVQQQSCQSGEVRFINWQPGSWFDPDLWRLSNSDGALVVEEDQPLLAVPHAERIPCERDSVHLSDRHSLSVDFNRVQSLTVGQIKYGEKYLTASEWLDGLNGPDWKYQVHHPPQHVQLDGTECPDSAGCLCANHNSSVMQMVCSNAGILCANYPLECPDGVRPPGHCCDLCGVVMKLTVDLNVFSLTSLDRLVSSMMGQNGLPGVQTFSYRTGEDVVHLVLADNTTNEKSIHLGRQIYDYLVKDRDSGNLYGIKQLELKQSGLSRTASHHLTPEELQLIKTNLMTAIAVIIIAAIMIGAFYVYTKRRMGSSGGELSFARFQNDPASGHDGGVEIAIETGMFSQPLAAPSLPTDDELDMAHGGKVDPEPSSTPYAEEPVIPSSSAAETGSPAGPLQAKPTTAAWKKLTRAFVNPLFGDPSAGHRLSGRWTMSSLMKTSATQENPIFDIRPPPTSAESSHSSPPAAETAEITTGSDPPSPPPPPSSSNADTPDDVVVEGATSDANGEEAGETDAPSGEVDDEPETREAQKTATGTVDASPVADGNDQPAGSVGGGAVKTFWKKAAQKFHVLQAAGAAGSTSDDQTAGDSAATAAAVTAGDHQPAVLLHHHHAQRSEDTVQLTLAEETDD